METYDPSGMSNDVNMNIWQFPNYIKGFLNLNLIIALEYIKGDECERLTGLDKMFCGNGYWQGLAEITWWVWFKAQYMLLVWFDIAVFHYQPVIVTLSCAYIQNNIHYANCILTITLSLVSYSMTIN